MKYGIGKWETRNGKMADVTQDDAHDAGYPLGGTVDGKYRTWCRGGLYYEEDECELDLIGPWKDKEAEPQPALNLMELPVGTWLKLKSGDKRRLNGNDGECALVGGEHPGSTTTRYHRSGMYDLGGQVESIWDVVAIWQEPKTLTVWVEVVVFPGGDYTVAGSTFPEDIKPDAKRSSALARRYVKVELVEGEFDDLPVEEK